MFLKNYYPKLNKRFFKFKFNGIAFNSSDVKKDFIFFAIKGNNLDGNKFIKDAIKNGSKIIISEIVKEEIKNNILYLRNKNPRKLLAEFAAKINYKRPNNMVAVTGTNGKSSVADFFYQREILTCAFLNQWHFVEHQWICIKINDKLFLFRSFDPKNNGNLEVPDPYYGGDQGFNHVCDIIERTCPKLLEYIKSRFLQNPWPLSVKPRYDYNHVIFDSDTKKNNLRNYLEFFLIHFYLNYVNY